MSDPTSKTTRVRDIPKLPLNHLWCRFSTDIAGRITAGRGDLSAMGEWEYPCEECASGIALKAIGDMKNA